MEGDEDYDDNEIDDYNDYDMENDDMKDELENLFLDAKNAEDPISAYKDVIEMESSNSNEKTMTIRAYKEICIIYLTRDDYEKFCADLQNLTKASKNLKEEIFKTKIFDEILVFIEKNDEKEEYININFFKYIKKMKTEAEESANYGAVDEIKNFVKKHDKYIQILKDESNNSFNFSKLFEEYNKIKEGFHIRGNNATENEKLLPQYESLTINKQIPLIKQKVQNWRNKEAKKFWNEWLDDYEKFSDLPIFYNEMIKTETCKIIGFNILIDLYDDNNSIEKVGFNASMFLYNILSKIFLDVDNPDLREYTVTSGLFSYILSRLQVLTEEIPRRYSPDVEKKLPKKEEKKEIKLAPKKNTDVFQYNQKSKGVGYSSYNMNDKGWDIDAFLEKQQKHRNFLIESIISFFAKFFNVLNLKRETLIKMHDLILESALLPCIENLFAENSAVELEKNSKLVYLYFEIISNFSKNEVMYVLLKDISKDYKPLQVKSIYNLAKELVNTISIYKSHLDKKIFTNSQTIKSSILDDILIYYKEIDTNIKKFEKSNDLYETSIKIIDINKLEPEKAYPLLLKKLTFDYTSLPDYQKKEAVYYNYSYNKNQKEKDKDNDEVVGQEKILRLISEYSNLQNSLPVEFTNSIFVRVDKDKIDHMVAIIFGSEGTPYSSGAFTFDVSFGKDYPNNPPHVEITSTGNGTVRFNPNLYSTGKVCLSLLGTWRGTSGENWNPKISTIYQVLISIQSIIMSDLVYYNEPGHEGELGTKNGNELNEGYSNIVRYNNIRVCMIDAIKHPPKGFENIIKIHFFLKRDKILKEVDSWIDRAEKVPYQTGGLVSCHNSSYSSQFAHKSTYVKELKKIRDELKTVLYSIKLDDSLLKQEIIENKIKKIDNSINNNNKIQTQKEIKFDNIENIDMSYDNTKLKKNSEMNDDIAKDRYSRYIGALGLDAVRRQSNANIFLSGLGALGVEIAKNLVLSGCKELVLHDTKNTDIYDLIGQFFLEEKDIGYNRAERCINKLQELNYYVKITLNKDDLFNKNLSLNDLDNLGFNKYNVIILTECNNDTLILFDKYCRKNKIYLIICDVYGCIGRIINDFGSEFECIDKDGEIIKECYIQNIKLINEETIISLNKNEKHGFEDGDLIEFYDFNSNDIYNDLNKKKFEIKVISPYQFKIEDKNLNLLIKNKEANINGINNNINWNKNSDVNLGKCRQVKQKINLSFKEIKYLLSNKNISNDIVNNYYDQNLLCVDYDKLENKYLITQCFNIINQLKTNSKNEKLNPNNKTIKETILKICKENSYDINYINKYILICSFYMFQFPTLAAFLGGFAAQEAIKSITQKYMPINQYMTYDCLELVENQSNILDDNNNFEIKNKNDVIKILFGDKYYQKLKNLNLLQVGAGAIGCELLKNFAVLGIGEGALGKLYITDPDVIEVSNLTRQFLFREKHLRLPKSSTAAAAAVQMNKNLKGHIFAKSEKLCEQTEYIFNDSFFKKLDVVANALDNVNARKYVDLRCTTNHISLLESGTHGPKGHVQVIIPFKTENYASQEDPENSGGEIPQCTLKMFPEETIHCLEWARDQFGKNFTQFPQDFNKVVYNIKNNLVQKDEFKKMKTCLKWLKKIPNNFEDCVKLAKEKYYKVFVYNIQKLLMVYPLDKKDKEGNLFWSLPKRPPKMVNFDIKNNLCIDFIMAYTYLIANMFNIDIKFKNPKSSEFKNEIIILVDRIKIDEKKLIENINLNAINEKYQKLEQEKEKDKSQQKTDAENNANDPNNTLDDKEFETLKNELITYIKKIGPEKIPNLIPVDFEKDNDMNGQIDLIYSMSGLRALNYSLIPYDWITCKIKAGKIIPALSTTTSCISALQTFELLKLIKGLDIKYYRNTFLNLAIPFMQSSEPGNVVNKKICGNLTSNVWDIWEINITKDNKEENCIKFLFEELRKKYNIYPKDIFVGKKPVYLSLINKGNQNIEKEMLTDLLGVSNDVKYLDIIVTFTEKEDSDKYLKNIPRIRINFK